MKEVIKFDSKFIKYSLFDKTKYIEKLLESNDLKLVIDSLIYINPDIIESFSIINAIFKKKNIKTKYNLTNLGVASLMINSLITQNKTKELKNYLNALNDKTLKAILEFEINNKTAFSHLKICKDFYKQFRGTSKKVIDDELNQEKVIQHEKDTKINSKEKVKKVLKKEIKSKKVKWSIGTLITIFIFVISYILLGYIYAIILFYNNHVYPNIYLNNKLIDGESHETIKEYLKDIDINLDNKVKLINANDTYEFTYKEIGVLTNTSELEEDLVLKYKDLNGFQKTIEILNAPKLEYQVEYTLDNNKYEKFLKELEKKVNLPKKEESIKILNENINYQKGINGFSLDTTNLDNLILESIEKENKEIPLNGHIEGVSNILSTINNKVGTFSTYYNESQARAKNIRNAVSKLNGKIVYPNEVFSFRNTVGPYNGSQGYVFYDKDVGSGVCQVSTTIYNVQLLLNLPIVSRYNHGEMVYYVDYGMDATVYGSSVDYKFKNNTEYPIYIEATATNGTLTISFWSNDKIIKEGYSYKPRVEQVGYLSYRTYLDTYYNGEYKETTYLNSSRYSKGK